MSQASVNKAPEERIAHQLQRRLREGGLILVNSVAIFLLLALLTFHPDDPSFSTSGVTTRISNSGGQAGAWVADLLLNLFGLMAYIFPLLISYLSWIIFREQRRDSGVQLPRFIKVSGFLLVMVTGSGLTHIHFGAGFGTIPDPSLSGGLLGLLVAEKGLVQLFSALGATLFLLALFLTGITVLTGISWIQLTERIGAYTLRAIASVQGALLRLKEGLRGRLQRWREARERAEEKAEAEAEIPPPPVVKSEDRKPPRIEPVFTPKEDIPVSEPKARQTPVINEMRPQPTPAALPRVRSGADFELPAIDLLDDPPETRIEISRESLEEMSRLLEAKLRDFRIEVAVESVHPGPVVTRFEIQPAPGVKVSQITNLAKDLARSLSTMSVRVVEVIPGKTTIGIEIPNEKRDMVYLSETVKSEVYQKSKSPLTIALGKDISGNPVAVDLAKMPHLLVAGTTGSGKSVAVNAMIISFLFNATPKEVRLIMVDPKMLELSIYDGIPHLLSPVVTDMKDAQNALRWCVAEMERRYKLMAKMGVRNLAGFNKKIRDAIAANEAITDPFFTPDPLQDEPQSPPELEPLPYIVVIVDELADMMMVVGKKVEELIARLAQKARAAGIHLILATQRPSVDVLTGLIKANIPTRIAFQVSSRIDSRTVIDQMGAETLLGHGDMLYLPPGRSVPERVHGAFVDDHEVHAVVDDLRQRGEADYIDEILTGPDESGGGGDSGGGGGYGGESESDPLYDQAIEIVTESRKASVSGIQRRLKIGYNRAARMVEDMETAGVVGPLQANGSREVLAPPPVRD
ncbi:MAG: DNA translocase FtsK 4TM domain-containing protein [Gammaproteobacteria bacterium]|nr:DNA translocase FtsK 4TM domain-containing protein [Gammaproteobacteria bacterium]